VRDIGVDDIDPIKAKKAAKVKRAAEAAKQMTFKECAQKRRAFETLSDPRRGSAHSRYGEQPERFTLILTAEKTEHHSVGAVLAESAKRQRRACGAAQV
jgi:hypothetical protein